VACNVQIEITVNGRAPGRPDQQGATSAAEPRRYASEERDAVRSNSFESGVTEHLVTDANRGRAVMGETNARGRGPRRDSMVGRATRTLLFAVLTLAGTGALFAATPTSTATPTPTSTSTPTASPTSTSTPKPSPTVSPTAPPSDHGTVTGLVLDDVTGLPLPGANVSIGTSPVVVTDVHGRFTLAASGASPVLVVSKPGMTTVERPVSFAAGVSVAPVDARLVTLNNPQTVGGSGATLTSGPVTIAIPAGAVGAPVPCQLTALSPQGLPGLLPLGWSPLAAFDLRATGVAMPLTASVSGLPAGTPYLATYDKTQHAWTLASPPLTAGADGVVSAVLVVVSGAYAVVVPDTGNLVPSAGQPLVGADLVAVPRTSTVTSKANPPSLPISGGSAAVSLNLQSSAPLPSGTVLTTTATESFTLASGAKGAEEQRTFDVLMFQNPPPAGGGLAGTIPVKPERTFLDAEFATGDLTLDYFRGRESVRGRVSDGNSEEVDDDDTHLLLPAGALPIGTSTVLEEAAALSAFLPSSNTLTPLSEFVVDFSGQTLASAAQVSVLIGTLSPGDTFLLARVDRYEGLPYLTVVSRAALDGDNVVSVPTPGLPGITVGGRYVIYRSAAPVGFIAGTTTATSGPVPSLVQGNNLPFVGLTKSDGSYILAAQGGAVSVTARVPGTPLAGGGSANVTANQTVALDIALTGQATMATVTPADGALLVPVSTQITINVPIAFDASKIIGDNIQLMTQGPTGPTTVSSHLQLSGNGKSVAVIPDALLAFTTVYTLQTTNLTDVNGAVVVVPATTFTTGANTPPAMHPEALVFSLPDANGMVTMSAPNGSFPVSSSFLVVDSGNGSVLSTIAGNQGQVAPIQMRATIDDELLVTVTDPLGNSISFKRSQYEDVAGHRTAVGPGGGVVKCPDGQ
jgi:hypothetical protein